MLPAEVDQESEGGADDDDDDDPLVVLEDGAQEVLECLRVHPDISSTMIFSRSIRSAKYRST